MTSRSRSALTTVLLLLLALAPAALSAQSAPKGSASGFRLYAKALAAITGNRVYCGLALSGEFCVDSTNSSTIGGGYWPKGSPQQYVFNSGLWVAGKIAGSNEWGWAGDTTGGFFFDAKGTTQHGEGVDGFWNSTNAAHRAEWPAAARVPASGASASFFAPALQGREVASDQDVWSLAWEGNADLVAGRPHPLGLAMETRVLTWNYPAGNEDIVYFLTTFYNISSACAVDYAGVRPELQETLRQLGVRFQAQNLAKTGVVIPTCGYTINDLYFAAAADMDVSSDAGANYSTVNLPLAMGYSYEHTFRRPEVGYALPEGIGEPPFTNGYGFVALKFLRTGEGAGVSPRIQMYSSLTGGGLFNDPQNTYQMYRYLTGQINQGLGDGACNYSPATDRICYVKGDVPSDTRFFETATAGTVLPPGGAVTVATAYIFASAVASPGCPVAGCGGGAVDIRAGDPRRLSNASFLASSGANLIDSMTGFRGYTDLNGDGVVQGNEFTAVRGSLIQKAQLAQAIFDAGFALPEAPEAPEFFLVPGDGKVSIFWRPSRTEQTGDGFFTSAAEPWSPTSPMYDPNYRQFDVEGYRVYRGRTNDPTRMTLLAQYDYDEVDSEGHARDFRDYLGVVAPNGFCAPELGRNNTAEGCPVNFDEPGLGGAYTVFTTYEVEGRFVQVKRGGRHLTAGGEVYVSQADTAFPGGAAGVPELENSGIPFAHVDETAVNDLRYFYAVTAFDVNSIQSGPSSFESPRVLKSATPMRAASNFENEAVVATGVFGRGQEMTLLIPTAPTIDPTNGTFSGPARPATGASIGLFGVFMKELMAGPGEISVTLDSMRTGSAYDPAIGASTFFIRITTATGVTASSFTALQDPFNARHIESGVIDGGPIDGARAARYGGSADYRLTAAYGLTYVGNYYTGSFGRGCVNSAPGFVTTTRCAYNGARWFTGANESFPHPNRGNGPNTTAATPTIINFTNAGSIPGVTNIFEPRSYQTRPNTYRVIEGVLGTVATGADYRLHWGAGGTVDSVVDVTHNVRVPFHTDITRGYTWGFLTQAQATVGGNSADTSAALTTSDLGCVEPIKSFPNANAHLACPAARVYTFVNTVSFGPIAIASTVATDGTAAVRPGQGFGIYLAGHFFLFEMDAPVPPAAGTVWTMRSYVGAISGGGGAVGTAGNLGTYAFSAQPSPFTAVGATLAIKYDVTNVIRSTTASDLAKVHTVPDPYYVSQGFALGSGGEGIKFVNLPDQAVVRIYSLSGVLVRVLEQNSIVVGGSLDWDIRNRDGRVVAPGVYFYAIESMSGERRVGRMTIVSNVE